jgi:hypothetical protein
MAAIGSVGGQTRVLAVDDDRVVVPVVAGDLRVGGVYWSMAMM